MEVLLIRLVNSSTFTLVQYIMGNQTHTIVAQMTHDKIQQESESSNGYHTDLHVVAHQSCMDQHMMDALCTGHMNACYVNPSEP